MVEQQLAQSRAQRLVRTGAAASEIIKTVRSFWDEASKNDKGFRSEAQKYVWDTEVPGYAGVKLCDIASKYGVDLQVHFDDHMNGVEGTMQRLHQGLHDTKFRANQGIEALETVVELATAVGGVSAPLAIAEEGAINAAEFPIRMGVELGYNLATAVLGFGSGTYDTSLRGIGAYGFDTVASVTEAGALSLPAVDMLIANYDLSDPKRHIMQGAQRRVAYKLAQDIAAKGYEVPKELMWAYKSRDVPMMLEERRKRKVAGQLERTVDEPLALEDRAAPRVVPYRHRDLGSSTELISAQPANNNRSFAQQGDQFYKSIYAEDFELVPYRRKLRHVA